MRKSHFSAGVATLFLLMVFLGSWNGDVFAGFSGTEVFVSAVVEGTRFDATSTAIYRLEILGGAFEVCPPGAAPDHPEWWGWRTEILIYKNRPVEWGGGSHAPEHPNPRSWDYAIGDTVNKPTYAEAEEAGKGMYVEIALEENDYLILTVNDAKGYFWDNSGGIRLSITECVSAEVDINPNNINLNRKKLLLTAFIELPEGYNVRNIDVSSVMLNRIVHAKLKPVNVGDHDGNGVPDLMIKFEIPIVNEQQQTTFTRSKFTATLTVTGKLLDGTPFMGSDTIRIIYPVQNGGKHGISPK